MNPVIPTALGQSLIGAQQGERAQAAQRTPAKRDAKRTDVKRSDEVVLNVEAPDAARSLKNNTDEEAHEDRQQHGLDEKPAQSRRIDVQG